MKSLKSYILLVCTWVLILGVVVYLLHLWFRQGQVPRVELLSLLFVLLVIVSAIPLAGRLRIGNWFDFRKRMDNLGDEVSEVKSMLANIQLQQQFNISVLDEKAARAFAEAIPTSKAERLLRGGTAAKTGSQEEDEFFSDKMSETDRMRFWFVSAANEALAETDPVVRILYAAKIKQEEREPTGEAIYLDKEFVSIVEELQNDWTGIGKESGKATEKTREYLASIRTLIRVRYEVEEGRTDPPSLEDGVPLLVDAYKAAAYLTGYISSGFCV